MDGNDFSHNSNPTRALINLIFCRVVVSKPSSVLFVPLHIRHRTLVTWTILFATQLSLLRDFLSMPLNQSQSFGLSFHNIWQLFHQPSLHRFPSQQNFSLLGDSS